MRFLYFALRDAERMIKVVIRVMPSGPSRGGGVLGVTTPGPGPKGGPG